MKDHGTFTTLAQVEEFLTSHQISTGRPTDIQIGDYFTLGSYKVYIAGIDTEYNKGSIEVTTHHITCIANFGNSKMNSTNTTSGGYGGATVMQSFLDGKATELRNICGSHLLNRKVFLSNGFNNGQTSGCTWYNKYLTLMSETQVYGSPQWATNGFDTGDGYEKLPIFNELTPLQIFGRAYIWLRGLNSASHFCLVDMSGLANIGGASASFPAVALFCLG